LLKADAAFAAELQKLLESAGVKVGGNIANASGTGGLLPKIGSRWYESLDGP
jgi:hypothetical protein